MKRELQSRILVELSFGAANTLEIAERISAFSWEVGSACASLAKEGKIRRLGREAGKTAPVQKWEHTHSPMQITEET